ncbi:DUF5776 domain-containing protein [Lentilactobacillus farraginis]|uniref:DUF5776 domain-containing protein n=1 Tax=Lentilactobacillus farraginis DSM 18382 = JCM 14108 TaxID=1423743 RepID=X0P9Y9_9LACO|nr:DUF5776 domain-containing protein [Lentilactobacillus farraginis]KRM11492.1 hypothetical protein FD41_GL001347 [Lentilactobacillus farraginis DSM 18382 = JCM 14108]GAF36099.1 hypothetical protein JCM14108_1043 [Lentilactobacillus farraginis DSM 18382 = JCM 14108]
MKLMHSLLLCSAVVLTGTAIISTTGITYANAVEAQSTAAALNPDTNIQILTKPTLKQRPENGMKVTGGQYVPFRKGFVAGTLGDLMHPGENIEVTGTGYIRIRTELEFWYHTGKVSMPEITAQTKDTKVQPVGEGYQFFSESAFNMSSDTPEVGYNDRFIWFSGTIKVGQLENDASYNIGVSGVDFNQVKNGTAVVYDTDNDILPPYSYKLISRGTDPNGYMDDQLVEARDRQFDTTGKYDATTSDNGATTQNVIYKGADEDTANQWWTFIYAGDQDGKHYYRLLNDLTGKYLSVANNNPGYNVITEDKKDNDPSQLWAISKADGESNPSLSTHISNAIYNTLQNKASQLYLTDDGSTISQQPLGKIGTALFEARYTRGYTDHNGDHFPDSLSDVFRLDSSKYKRYEAESLSTSKYSAQGTDTERNWRGNSDISGTRFVRLNQANPTLTQTIDVPQTGPYNVLIHYGSNADVKTPVYVKSNASGGPGAYISNNGNLTTTANDTLDSQLAQQTINFSNNATFPMGPHGKTSQKSMLPFSDGSIKQAQIYLHAGKNDITFSNPTSSALDIDYIDVGLQSTNPVADTTATTGAGTSSTATVTTPTTSNNNNATDASIASTSTSQSSSTASVSQPVTTTPTTPNQFKPKSLVVYNKYPIYEYKKLVFSKTNRLSKVKKKTVLKVVGSQKSPSGLRRYRLTNGHYITANARFIAPLYIYAMKKKAVIINNQGAYEYASAALHKKDRIKHLKKGTRLHIKRIVKFHSTTRLELTNGHYISGNKFIVHN